MLISYKLNHSDRDLLKSRLIASGCHIDHVNKATFRISYKKRKGVQAVFFDQGLFLTHGITFPIFKSNRDLLKMIDQQILSIEPDQS